MKKTTLFAVAAALLAAGCNNPTPQYTIRGVLPDSTLHGKTVILSDYSTQQPIDSTLVDQAGFTFNGRTDSARACFIRIENTNLTSHFVLEKGEINLSMGNVPTPVLPETPLNRALYERVEAFTALMQQVNEKRQAFIANNPHATSTEWSEVYKREHSDSVDRQIADLFKGHEDDAVALLLTPTLGNVSLNRQLEVIATLSPQLQQTPLLSERKQKLEALQKTQVGSTFTDIVGTNLQGDTVALADYIGKGNYVLMDVWASWCRPCKQQIPYIARLHNLYKDKGLTVVGVFVWDKTENLAPAMEAEGITWPQIIDSNQNATLLYGIGGIPEIILFAPDGTIVEREGRMRGEQLIETVEDYLKSGNPKTN